LREAGVKVGYFRPITLRPLPEKQLREVASKAKKLLIAESSVGQLARLVKDCIYGCSAEIIPLFKPGVGITAEEITAKVKSIIG